MKSILIISPYLISTLIGYGLIQVLFRKLTLDVLSRLFLSGGIGLGLSALITFLSFIFFNRLAPVFVVGLNLSLLLGIWGSYFFYFRKTSGPPKDTTTLWKELCYLIFLILLAIPLWFQSDFYAYGGWDAWSAWNLKAKFLFLGGDNWRNMFDPLLWRSSPHYPLLLPLINVWGWIFSGEPVFEVPVITSFLFTFFTVGLLFTGLKRLTGSLYSFLPSVVLLTLPLFNKLSLSQYSDNVVAFYLLATFFSLLCAKEERSIPFALLAGLCLGLLSFSKSEGFIASSLIACLGVPYLLWRTSWKEMKRVVLFFAIATFLFFLPTIVFDIFYAPKNITFIDGFTSSVRASSFLRLKIILGFYFFEMFTPLWNVITFFDPPLGSYLEPKWHGLWLICLLGLFLNIKKCCNARTIIFPCFFILYGLVLTIYYLMNTYFPIGWWLQVTLHRILFAILPTVLFWVFYSLWLEDPKKNHGGKR